MSYVLATDFVADEKLVCCDIFHEGHAPTMQAFLSFFQLIMMTLPDPYSLIILTNLLYDFHLLSLPKALNTTLWWNKVKYQSD